MKKINIWRTILVVLAMAFYFVGNAFAYEIKDNRVMYDAYEVSVMTVTDGSEKHNQLYWCAGKDLYRDIVTVRMQCSISMTGIIILESGLLCSRTTTRLLVLQPRNLSLMRWLKALLMHAITSLKIVHGAYL